MVKSFLLSLASIMILSFICNITPAFAQPPSMTYDQRACCDGHGGSWGCDQSDGRVVCKDGTLAPACRCFTQGSPEGFGSGSSSSSSCG